jgi:MFS family permease
MAEEDKQGWRIVAVLFATMFLIWGPINASGVFFIPVIKHFGWSRALFSLLTAAAPLAAGFSSPALGSLMDRYGERRIMIIGASMVALGYLSLSRADSAAAFFVTYIVMGVGISASTIIPAALVITAWFRERRGVALGIAFAGIPLGGTAITILASRVMQHSGFRAGYLTMAMPILFIVVPLLELFMRSRPQTKEETIASDSYEDSLPGLEVSEALRSRSFWMIAISEVMLAMAGVGLRVHLVPLLTGAGYAPTRAAEIFGAMLVFSAIGTFGVGRVADRLGGRATAATIFFAAAGIATLLSASHLLAVAIFTVVFGLVRETPTAILPIVATESLGQKRLGALLGLGALFTTLGFAAEPIIGCRIFDRTGSYNDALILFSAMAFISMLAIRATLPLAEEEARLGDSAAIAPEPVI